MKHGHGNHRYPRKADHAHPGVADKFNRAPPELETYLEGEVANGESSETRLTYNGPCFVREVFAR
jgi:hypothetical protein